MVDPPPKLQRSCDLTVGYSAGFVLAECVLLAGRHPTLHADTPCCCCLPDVSFLRSLYLVLNSIHCGTGLEAVGFQAKGNSSL